MYPKLLHNTCTLLQTEFVSLGNLIDTLLE